MSGPASPAAANETTARVTATPTAAQATFTDRVLVDVNAGVQEGSIRRDMSRL